MPIYTYQCRECKSVEDYIVLKIGGMPEEGCKRCGHRDMLRVYTGQNFGVVGKSEPSKPFAKSASKKIDTSGWETAGGT